MTTIGDKQVAFQITLVVPDGEIAAFDAAGVKMEIQFHPSNNTDNRISWQTKVNVLHMDFNGLDNSLGVAAKEAIRLGTAPTGEPLGFLFFHHRAGNMNRIDFLLLKGGQYAQ
jgi:hypothetical protein